MLVHYTCVIVLHRIVCPLVNIYFYWNGHCCLMNIMKVRSATLDTWLPEQVTFIQCKCSMLFAIWNFLSGLLLLLSYIIAISLCWHSYGKWEIKQLLGSRIAPQLWPRWNWELHPCKVGIKRHMKRFCILCLVCFFFISFALLPIFTVRAKFIGCCNFRYEEKRWVLRDGRERSPYIRGEEDMPSHQSRLEERNGHVYVNKRVGVNEERKGTVPSSTREVRSTGRISIPSPPKGVEQVRILLHPSSLQVLCADSYI